MGLGIMGTMEMARNSMRVARAGAEVSGNNLANASNPIYARQRIKINSAVAIPTEKGPQGSGSEVSRLEQVRDKVLDKSIVYENSLTGELEGKQLYLRRAEASLGQTVDSQTIDAGESYGTYGLAEGMTELFNSFQSLSVSPTSTAERETILSNAKKISSKLNAVDDRLGRLRSSINEEIKDVINEVNGKIAEVAYIAINIGNIEQVEGSANEVRDSLQAAMESLARYVTVKATTNETGELSVFINEDFEVITDNVVTKAVALETDASSGMYFMAQQSTGTRLNLKSGYIKGMIDARDVPIKNLKDDVSTLAEQLITEVNTLHQSGFDLYGNTGQAFFSGTNASDIAVNATIADDPRKLQGSSSSTEASNNAVLRSIAALSDKAITGLNGITFSEYYGNTVSRYGREVALTTSQLNDQNIVGNMLSKQRESIMGVSIDEEVANLVIYQRAFQASAKLLTTMDRLLEDVLNMTN